MSNITKYISIGTGILVILMGIYIWHLNTKISGLETQVQLLNDQKIILENSNSACGLKLQTLSNQTKELQSRLDKSEVEVSQLRKDNQKYINQIKQSEVSNDAQDSLDWLINETKQLNNSWNNVHNY